MNVTRDISAAHAVIILIYVYMDMPFARNVTDHIQETSTLLYFSSDLCNIIEAPTYTSCTCTFSIIYAIDKAHAGSIPYSVRNSGQHADIVRPF